MTSNLQKTQREESEVKSKKNNRCRVNWKRNHYKSNNINTLSKSYMSNSTDSDADNYNYRQYVPMNEIIDVPDYLMPYFTAQAPHNH